MDGVGVGIPSCFAGLGQRLALGHVVQRVLGGGILVLLEGIVEPRHDPSGYRLAHNIIVVSQCSLKNAMRGRKKRHKMNVCVFLSVSISCGFSLMLETDEEVLVEVA